MTFQDSMTRRDYCVPTVLNHLADEDYWWITGRHCMNVLVTVRDCCSKRSKRLASIDPAISRSPTFEAWFCG